MGSVSLNYFHCISAIPSINRNKEPGTRMDQCSNAILHFLLYQPDVFLPWNAEPYTMKPFGGCLGMIESEK